MKYLLQLVLLAQCCSGLNIDAASRRRSALKKLAPYFDDKTTRELTGNRVDRIYANATKLRQLSGETTRDNLITPPGPFSLNRTETIWITAPYRVSVLLVAYALFPFLVEGIRATLPEAELGEVSAVTSGFVPAISLLYGAWLGLTFNILQERIGQLQTTASKESSMFCALCERTSLITDSLPPENVVPIFKPLFDQTTTLAMRSREDELLLITNDDIYLNYRRSLKSLATSGLLEDQINAGFPEITSCNDLVDNLMSIRAERLSIETTALPAAHFSILSIFSFQLLACFIYAIAQTPAAVDDPALRIAFSFFVGVYLLVFNFAVDLNDPFRGNYQIRRSAINANLIATRKLIASRVGEDLAAEWRDKETGLGHHMTRSQISDE
mmetsp:Transcript_76452/g.153502  ORF Transcript_76452/g.153502 Transcript_76452/m.153502 type:complete len:384 (-) Transcript_76452:177-1328(-)